MKLIFAGTSEFAVTVLEALVKSGHEVLCVICQPDRPRGRKKQLTPCPVKRYADENDLTVYQPEKISDPDSVAYISALEAKAFIVAAYGQKIPSSLLYFAPMGAINVHGSVLPELRGAAPIQHAIIRGFATTGVTTMLMNEGMDTGDILLTAETPISDDDTYGSLSARLARMGADLLLHTLEQGEKGLLAPVRQNDALATKAMSIKKEDTRIDFGKPAREVFNLVRGLYPSPCATASVADTEAKIMQAELAEEDACCGRPGEIIYAGKKGICIACGRGSVLITRLQPAGGREMDGAAFANRLDQAKRQ